MPHMTVVSDYTALLSGDYWNGIEVTGKPTIVTYSFPTTAPGYLADVDVFTPATLSSFQGFNSTEQDQARAALGEWAAASGITSSRWRRDRATSTSSSSISTRPAGRPMPARAGSASIRSATGTISPI